MHLAEQLKLRSEKVPKKLGKAVFFGCIEVRFIRVGPDGRHLLQSGDDHIPAG